MVTLLAVVGESAIAEHAQTLTASALCLLPRIIPAPQALLRPQRPLRLPKTAARVSGVYSGVSLDSVGFFANILHPLEDLPSFAFRVLEIRHRSDLLRAPPLRRVGGGDGGSGGEAAEKRDRGLLSGLGVLVKRWRGRKRREGTVEEGTSGSGNGQTECGGNGENEKNTTDATLHATNPEGGNVTTEPPPGTGFRRRPTISDKFADVVTDPSMVHSEDHYAVPPALYSPLHVLSVFSFFITIGIVATAIAWEDGAAILAICLISVAGTIVCYASWWRPILMHRPAANKVPEGDVVIRTREGAFLLVRCTEEVARELYSGGEECRYVIGDKYHRAFMGLGMVLLMVSVVLLGNCEWNSQVLIGSAYVLLNGLYWAMGLLPQKYFWDLSRYEVRDTTPDDAQRAHETTDPSDPHEGKPSFTRTLWYAIREAKHSAWVNRSGALPATDQWEKWLREADAAAWSGDRKWPAVQRKNAIMKEAAEAKSAKVPRHAVDEAEQRAPLSEVQLPWRDA